MIALGSVKGWQCIHKFGHNSDLGTGIEDIWNAGGVYTYLTSAVSLEAISTSADDAAAGTGARTIRVEGLDADFKEVSEDITMNGLSATTATTQTFLRINRAYVLTTGTYGVGSAGDITIRTESAGATHAKIEYTTDGTAWDMGQTQLARYTVPAGKVAFVTSLDLGIDGTKRADIVMFQRQNADTISAPFTAKRVVKSIDGFSGDYLMEFDGPLIFPAKTDIIFKGRLTSGANGRVHVSFDIFVGDVG